MDLSIFAGNERKFVVRYNLNDGRWGLILLKVTEKSFFFYAYHNILLLVQSIIALLLFRCSCKKIIKDLGVDSHRLRTVRKKYKSHGGVSRALRLVMVPEFVPKEEK